MQACTAAAAQPGGRWSQAGRAAPPPPPAARTTAAPRTRCGSVASDVTTAAATSTDEQPPSWPSAQARAAGYDASPREPALRVPAAVAGKLPDWLRGAYIRNGPGDLRPMEHMVSTRGKAGRECRIEAWGHRRALFRPAAAAAKPRCAALPPTLLPTAV